MDRGSVLELLILHVLPISLLTVGNGGINGLGGEGCCWNCCVAEEDPPRLVGRGCWWEDAIVAGGCTGGGGFKCVFLDGSEGMDGS